ncbi:porin (plasmid) [Cupriavidus metallidurans]|nr:porin [Cupriavidus metallidurans]
MKRALLASTALGLLLCTGYAHSSVTLYGVVDSNIEYVNKLTNASGASGSVVRNSGGGFASNRWGVRGVEDLGGGLKGIFTVEGGFNVDTGTQFNANKLYDRQTFVGVSSDEYGQLTFGRQYSTIFRALANFSPSAYAPMYEPLSFLLGMNLRNDNSVNYVIQRGSIGARLHWTFGNGVFGAGETPGEIRANAGYGASLEYSAGEFGASIAYDQFYPTLTTLGDNGIGNFRKAAIGAGYNLGKFRFSGGYRWGRNEFSNGSVALRDDFLWFGVNYQVAPKVNLMLAYYYDKLHTLRAQYNGAELDRPNPYQVSFMASYDFSKRTNVYLTTAYSKNVALAFGGLATTAASGAYLLGAGKSSQVGAALGIRHIF